MAKSQRCGGKSVHGAAYRSVDLDESDVGLLVDVSDLGVKRGAAFQLHLQETKALSRLLPSFASSAAFCTFTLCLLATT